MHLGDVEAEYRLIRCRCAECSRKITLGFEDFPQRVLFRSLQVRKVIMAGRAGKIQRLDRIDKRAKRCGRVRHDMHVRLPWRYRLFGINVDAY